MTKSSFNRFGSKIVGAAGDTVKELKGVLEGKKEPASHSPPADVGTLPAADHSLLDQEIKELKSQIEEAQKSATEHKEKYLRTLAEFENFRKRIEKEKDESVRFGNEKLLKEFIPVLDHLEMTLSHATPKSDEEPTFPSEKDPILEGIELVTKQFVSVLQKHGVEVVEGEGEAFDPHRQESIGTIETDKFSPGTVVKVHRKGYLLANRLVRPALVTVAKEPSSKEEDSREETIH